MSEVSEQSHHLKPPGGSPSGGSSRGGGGGGGGGGDPLSEHPPSCKQRSASPEPDARGRQRDRQQQPDRESINADKLWQSKGAQQRGVCRDSAAGNQLPKSHPHKKADGNHHHHHASDHHGNGEGGDHHIDSDTGLDPSRGGGKRRHRRRTSRKKRHWKPYFKLSWEEKKALDERETARASRVREEMFAKGLPVAPYNTTQFLMDEHDREEPDLNTEGGGPRRPSGLEDTGSEEDFLENHHHNDEEDEEDGSDGIGRPGNAGGEFLQRDFSETYEMYHVESLQNMTKQELIREYLELEKCMSRLEDENNRLRRAMEPPPEEDSGSLRRLRELEGELERLRAQNSQLLLQKNQTPTDN